MQAVNLVLDAPSLTCVSSLEWTRDQVLSLEQAVDGRHGTCLPVALPACRASLVCLGTPVYCDLYRSHRRQSELIHALKEFATDAV